MTTPEYLVATTRLMDSVSKVEAAMERAFVRANVIEQADAAKQTAKHFEDELFFADGLSPPPECGPHHQALRVYLAYNLGAYLLYERALRSSNNYLRDVARHTLDLAKVKAEDVTVSMQQLQWSQRGH